MSKEAPITSEPTSAESELFQAIYNLDFMKIYDLTKEGLPEQNWPAQPFLFYAIQTGHILTIEAILKAGADPNMVMYAGHPLDVKAYDREALAPVSPDTYEYPIKYAMMYHRDETKAMEIIDLLLENGANLRDMGGLIPPVFFAAYIKNLTYVKYFIENKEVPYEKIEGLEKEHTYGGLTFQRYVESFKDSVQKTLWDADIEGNHGFKMQLETDLKFAKAALDLDSNFKCTYWHQVKVRGDEAFKRLVEAREHKLKLEELRMYGGGGGFGGGGRAAHEEDEDPVAAPGAGGAAGGGGAGTAPSYYDHHTDALGDSADHH